MLLIFSNLRQFGSRFVPTGSLKLYKSPLRRNTLKVPPRPGKLVLTHQVHLHCTPAFHLLGKYLFKSGFNKFK